MDESQRAMRLGQLGAGAGEVEIESLGEGAGVRN